MLSILNHGDNYGYPIAKIIAQHLIVKDTTVYLILQRLEKQSLISSYRVESEEHKIRKYYQLTPLGKERLDIYTDEWNKMNQTLTLLIQGDF